MSASAAGIVMVRALTIGDAWCY